jgi:multidrug efflux pump subunit AcrA (membrane-fusion protein)
MTEQGRTVKKGQILAQLERLQLELELKQAQSAYDSAKSQLELSQARLEDGLRNIERQFLAIEKSKAELEDKKNSAENMLNTLNNKKTLLDAGAVTDESIRNLETQYHSLKTQVLIAERDLKSAEIGFRDKDIMEAGFKIPSKQEEKIRLFKKINTVILQKEVQVSESSLKSAKTKLDSIKIYLEETVIRSPMDGIIAARYVEEGEEAKPDTKLFTVMNTRSVYAKISVSESDLTRVKPDGRVILSADALGGRKYNGTIELISPVIDTKTRTVELSVLVENADGILKPGMFVRAKIKSDESRKALFIPATALISKDKDKALVFVVSSQILFKKEVTCGAEKDDRVEILNGLKKGDIVIPEPTIEMQEGMKIEIIAE